MRKLAIFLPLLAGFAAVPAYSQSLGVTGRAEIRGGYDEVRADLTVQNSIFNDDFGVSNFMLGAEAGVDVRFSSIVVGGYVGIDVSKVDDCVENPFSRRQAARRDVACIDAGRNLYAGGRVGLAIGDGTLPIGQGGLIYAKGGVSRGKFAGSYTATTVTAGQRTGLLFSGRDTVSGYHFGGGFELDVIAACVIGGISIMGGVGSVAGAVMGALAFVGGAMVADVLTAIALDKETGRTFPRAHRPLGLETAPA